MDAAISAPCDRPEAFLTASAAEVIIGRLGDALALCGRKHEAAVSYGASLAAIINSPR